MNNNLIELSKKLHESSQELVRTIPKNNLQMAVIHEIVDRLVEDNFATIENNKELKQALINMYFLGGIFGD